MLVETRKLVSASTCSLCGNRTPRMYKIAQPISVAECIDRVGPFTTNSESAWYCEACASSLRTMPWAYRYTYGDSFNVSKAGYVTLQNDAYRDLSNASKKLEELERALKNATAPVSEPDGPDDENAADMVNDPPHYRSSVPGIESIKCIEASMSKEEFLGFLKGTVMKYIWRYRNKGGVQDLEKAQWFQKMLIEKYKEMLEVRDA